MSILYAIGLAVVVILVIWAVLGAIAFVGSILPWIIVGLISGALASRLVQGRGMGCLMDTVVGMAGALLAGLVIHFVDPSLIGAGGLLGLVQQVIVSFLGAVVVIGVVRLFSPRRGRVGGRGARLRLGR
jgi:uncharacterized membrane protein YeaQ/YmgE (transglycosylase-associated protein family)